MGDQVLRSVARYEILRELGRGGMAVVHLARQKDLDRLVALKELGVFRAEDPEFVRRFVRESQLAGSLGHANIVTVHEYFVYDDVPYIAMEYAGRGSLRNHLGRMTLAQIAGALEGMLAAVAHATARGIVHRDIKPENVMVTADGRVKVADFGIAKAIDRLDADSMLTAEGMAVGTPAYMAPEQALAQPLGLWTDQFSVGVVAFEMLVGRRPFTEQLPAAAALLRLVNTPMPSPRDIDPTLDEGIAAWVTRTLAQDPGDRFSDAQGAWEELEHHIVRLLGPLWRRSSGLLSEPPSGVIAEVSSAEADCVADHAGDPTGTVDDADWSMRSTALLTPPGDDGADRPAAALPPTSPPPGPWTPPPGDTAVLLPEPWIAEDDLPTPAPAPPDTLRVPDAVRPGMPAPRIAIAAALSVLLAAGGAAMALSGVSSREAGAPAAGPPRLQLVGSASSATVQLGMPAGWKRVDADDAVPGITLRDAVAISGSRGGEPQAVAGITDARNTSLLPRALIDDLPVASRARLGELQALAYRDVRVGGRTRTFTLLAAPTTEGVVILACLAPGSGGPACRRVAESLSLVKGQGYDIGPSADFATSTTATLGRLSRVRRIEGRALRGARTASGQARVAQRLVVGYRSAGRAQENTRVSPAYGELNDALVRDLLGVAAAHRTLADAARRGSRSAYRSASARVGRSRNALDRAVARLEGAGYASIPSLTSAPAPPALRRLSRKRVSLAPKRQTNPFAGSVVTAPRRTPQAPRGAPTPQTVTPRPRASSPSPILPAPGLPK